MFQEKIKGMPPEGEQPPPSTQALDQPNGQPQKLLTAGNPRLALDSGAKPRSRKWFWIVAGALILLVFLIVRSLSGTHGAQPAKNPTQAPAAITIGQATSGDINIYIQALGTVTPLNTVTVYSQITGRVMSVHYHEGQMVRLDDPLIDVDPRPYEATLKQAEGALDRDRGSLAEARIDLDRYKAAYAKNAIARQQVEDQEQTVVQDEGTVKADEGTVAYDQTQLSYCHIVAPISGRVGLRLVDPGNTIFSGSNSTLVVITQLQPITVVFTVSEDDLPQVNAQLHGGQRLTVDAFDRANENRIASGALTSLDNEVDTTTGTVKFRAEFPNSNLSLFPNQFVNARLLVTTLRKATLVPTAAIQHNGTASFVYLVQPDHTVAVQDITILTSNDQVTAVTGVEPGADLATSGFDRLEAGVHVVARGQAAGQKSTKGAAGKQSPSGAKSK